MTARSTTPPTSKTKAPKPPGAPAGQPTGAPKGSDSNLSDPSGYADYQTEKGLTGQGEAAPTQRSKVVPRK